jgi:hypothetical protein
MTITYRGGLSLILARSPWPAYNGFINQWEKPMKKSWIFVMLSLAMLFSLGFAPAPANETPSNALAEFHLINQTPYKAQVLLWGGINAQSYYVYLPPRGAKSINVKPASYWVDIMIASDKCIRKGRDMKIIKKTNLTVVCSRPK